MVASLVASLSFTLLGAAGEDSWPGFRGDGTSLYAGKPLPTTWSPKEAAWKIDLPGYGQSSPVVFDGRVYVTAVSGPNKETNHAVALDAASGKVLWKKDFSASQKVKASNLVSRAAATPAVAADGLFVFFESGDVVALDHAGQVRWQRSLTKEYGEFDNKFGLGASVVLSAKALHVLVDDTGPSYLVGLDRGTGKNLWKKERASRSSWTSPVLQERGGRQEVVVSSAGSVDAYDAATGEVLWRFDDLSGNGIPSATPVGDRILIGANESPTARDLAALRRSNLCLKVAVQDGKPTPEAVWRAKKAVSSMASPVAHRGYAYIVDKIGQVFCLDVRTGEEVYAERLDGACWATPIAAGDHVYFFGKDGVTTVLRAGAKFEKVARNELWDPRESVQAKGGGRPYPFGQLDPLLYGVAAADGAFYFRTGTRLYCVRGKR